MPSTSSSPTLQNAVNRRYTTEQYQLALKAVREDGLTTLQASALYGVPKSTIWHRLYAGSRSSSSSSSASAPARKLPYTLRRLSAPTDSSQSLKTSPYQFRQQRTSSQSPVVKHGKRAASPQGIQPKTASPQGIQPRTAGDTG